MNQDKDISILKDLGLKWDLDTIFNKDTLPQIGLYAIEQSEESSSHYCVGDTHQQGSQPEIKTTVALLQILLSMLLTKKAKKQTKNNPPPKKTFSIRANGQNTINVSTSQRIKERGNHSKT